MGNDNILQDVVGILKNAQNTGSLPPITVKTVIELDNSTIFKTGLALFGAMLVAVVVGALIIKKL
jgi:hypothetical protein